VPNLYEILVAKGFKHQPPYPNRITDTREPIAQYIFENEDGAITLSIHNFSIAIPPAAQVERWKKQIPNLSPYDSITIPQAFSGFSGLGFKGSNDKVATFAWALTLNPELERQLARMERPEKKEASSNVTIKAVGPKSLMYEYEGEIDAMARSFQLSFGIPKYP